MISFKHESMKPTKVYLGRKMVGEIRKVAGGFQYVPKGQKFGGKVMPTREQVMRDLQGD